MFSILRMRLTLSGADISMIRPRSALAKKKKQRRNHTANAPPYAHRRPEGRDKRGQHKNRYEGRRVLQEYTL